VVHHHPSPRRDAGGRRRLLLRNALWCAWLRRPAPAALRLTLLLAWRARRDPALAAAVAGALAGAPWILRRRRVVPAHVEGGLRLLEMNGTPGAKHE
jgi:hypothetical protein